jgi:hypothetical protein
MRSHWSGIRLNIMTSVLIGRREFGQRPRGGTHREKFT